jgi:hypothetical protein
VESEPIDEALAADGIDEMLTVMLEARSLPEWARWESDGGPIRIEVPERNWRLVTGRVVGTDPDGEARALPAVRLIEDGAGSGDAESAVLRGPASIIDRWLWRRGTLDGPGIEVDGDRAVLDRLRDLADVD